jgi:hypothetical protein
MAHGSTDRPGWYTSPGRLEAFSDGVFAIAITLWFHRGHRHGNRRGSRLRRRADRCSRAPGCTPVFYLGTLPRTLAAPRLPTAR